jgi:hypothetical protein
MGVMPTASASCEKGKLLYRLAELLRRGFYARCGNRLQLRMLMSLRKRSLISRAFAHHGTRGNLQTAERMQRGRMPEER